MLWLHLTNYKLYCKCINSKIIGDSGHPCLPQEYKTQSLRLILSTKLEHTITSLGIDTQELSWFDIILQYEHLTVSTWYISRMKIFVDVWEGPENKNLHTQEIKLSFSRLCTGIVEGKDVICTTHSSYTRNVNLQVNL